MPLVIVASNRKSCPSHLAAVSPVSSGWIWIENLGRLGGGSRAGNQAIGRLAAGGTTNKGGSEPVEFWLTSVIQHSL